MSDVLILIAAGAAMGFFGSIPLTGPIAVMALNQAVNDRFKRGFVIGVGGTLGELIYCSLAVAGVGAMIEQLPTVRVWIRGLSAVLLFGVGVYFLWNTPEEDDEALSGATGEASAPNSGEDDYFGAFASAFSVAAFNPVLLLNWTAAVAFVFSHLDVEVSPAVGAGFVLSIGVGVVGWYAVLMGMLRRYRDTIPTELLAWVQRVMSVFVIGGALYLGAKTGLQLL